jgi:reductive dehalogenase
MIFTDKNKKRPYALGPFPLESLPHSDTVRDEELARPARPSNGAPPASHYGQIAGQYQARFEQFRDGESAPEKAPVPDDLGERTTDLKGFAYFLDSAHVGVCKMADAAWLPEAETRPHTHALVIVVEHGRMPESDNLAYEWVKDSAHEVGNMRASEIAICLARYIRTLGYGAITHTSANSDVDAEKLAVLAGVAYRDADGISSPYIGKRFSLAVITMDYELECDAPLAIDKSAARGLRYWLGINGATSGRERARRERRKTHMSRYPMEQVTRIDRPSTLIIDDEVPRVPKRANFFVRAAHGDLGAKAQREVGRFIGKSTYNVSLFGPMGTMPPFQGGEVADVDTSQYQDAAANTKALKSLSYFMGADLTGICKVPDYAWYSHKDDGTPIEPYHKYAIVMLIDQGFETMEGASGDDWISGVQSMRAYMRGAEIAGIMATHIRSLGFSARAQTQADSDVTHIPLLMWAGLGELSRIGELVLNPFVGPRFKSVVLTTDMPLEPDKPIDFGLQYFCSNCYKCARECPCDAMPFGDKVMFNGYEMWKPDVDRCVRYRVTNPKGSACGRCMKTCPLNKVPTLDGPLVHRIGTWLGVNARWLKPLLVPIAVYFDDKLGYGKRNRHKKWWIDLEIDDGVCHVPTKGSNERELDLEREVPPPNHKVAYYSANVIPPAGHEGPWKADRKAALESVVTLETPEQARKRKAAGGAKPEIYVPPPPAKTSGAQKVRYGSIAAEPERIRGPLQADVD